MIDVALRPVEVECRIRSAIPNNGTQSAAADPLVDDFADARELYAESFAFRGYRMITAGSGAEALDVARRPETPALILMDLALGGGVSGTDVMLTLRRDPAFAAVPIIAFTARALRNEQDEALLAGFDAVIPKPCLPDDLMRLIQPFLDGRTAA